MRAGATFVAAKDVALGAMICEDIDTVVVAGGGSHSNFHIFSLQGTPVKVVRGDTSDAFAACFDRNTLRSILLSRSSNDIRIFRIQTTFKDGFRDFTLEHTLCGHTTPAVSASFNASGNRLFSLSLNSNLKMWDLSLEGFKEIHIPCISTFDISQILPRNAQLELTAGKSKLRWIGTRSDSTPEQETHILAISESFKIHVVQVSSTSCTHLDTIESPHGEDFLNGLHYIFDSKNANKGVLVSVGQKRVFGWKVRY